MSCPAWLFRIVPYLGRRRAGEDLEQEMRLHVELERDRLVDVGVAPDAAACAARRRLGNPALIREDTRAVWGWCWLDGLVRDLRHVARGLRRSPGFTAVVYRATAQVEHTPLGRSDVPGGPIPNRMSRVSPSTGSAFAAARGDDFRPSRCGGGWSTVADAPSPRESHVRSRRWLATQGGQAPAARRGQQVRVPAQERTTVPPRPSDRAVGGRRHPPKRGRARVQEIAPIGGGPSARRSPSLIRSLVVKTIALRDLGTHSQEAHVREETLLTANNGRPVAVLLPVDAGTVDETLEVVRRARGLEALRAIRRESQSSGAARMTPADIDALVTRTRRSRPR